MTPRATTLARLAVVALAAAPAAARAGTFDIFGFTARDAGVGDAMTAAARGYSALYYNPAALTADKQQRVGMGFALTLPSLYVDRSNPASDRPTVSPGDHLGFHLGWVKPIPGIFRQKVAVGVSLYLPAERLVRVQGVDPQSPQFYLYQNLQDKLLLHAGAAVEPLDWLSFGLGVQILADLAGTVGLEMNIVSGSFERTDLDVSLAPTASLLAGVLVRPAPGVSLGLSYRGESALQFTLPVTVREGQALSLAIDVAQTVLWTPHQLSLGLAWQLDAPRLLLALDATYALWSRAPDPSPRLSVDIGGRLLDAFGLADALDLSTRSAPIALGFSDTLIARVGAEWEAADWLVLRAGYCYRPTPAPRQTGVTAYLDNDAHVIALGAGLAFLHPFRSRQTIVQLDLAAQLTYLPRRTIVRLDPRDPVGDVSHGGMLWTFSATLSHGY